MQRNKNRGVIRALAVVLLASAFNHFADRILAVRIEVFTGGIGYFSPSWVVDMFLVPFVTGVLVAVIYGFGGKWLSYVPCLIVRGMSYYDISMHLGDLAPGSSLMPIGWWGFYVILVVESAGIGGVIGEVMVKRTYGRSRPPKTVEPRPARR